MPELPDLQVFSMHLNKQLAGKKLIQVNLLRGAKANKAKSAIKKALEKQKLVKVYREGKELRMAFANDHILGLHLMLHGKLEWLDGKHTPKHALLELRFEGDKQLVLTDFQRQATITLDPGPSTVPDALSRKANTAFWRKQLQTKTAIKNLMLDQHIIRGIGNAYADEILWQAGISPFSVSNKIPPHKIRSLATLVKKVLKKAIQHIHKASPGIIGGEMREFLHIHNAHRKKSPGGALIKTKTAGGRKTYFTDEQVLFT